MRQVLQARRNGITVVRDVSLPSCPPGGVVVQNAFSAISSGTERARVEMSQKSLIGKARERPDLVREVFNRARREGAKATVQAVRHRLSEEAPIGYSSAGIVVEVGEHARGLRSGDRVACAGGAANHAEFVAVPANLCARVPDAVPLESAALTTIAAIAMHGIRLAGARLGSRVAVIGCGLVGQIALRLLHAAGAETFALDIDPLRIAQAGLAGADHAIAIDGATAESVWTRTGAVGVDEVLVTAAAQTNEPLVLGTRIARDRAALVLVGAVPIDLPRSLLYEKELRFRVSRSYGPGRYDSDYEERGLDYPIGYVRWTEKRNMEAVLRLQAQGLVSLSDLVEVVPVEQAATAYARLKGPSRGHPRGAFLLSYHAVGDVLSDGSRGALATSRANLERVEGVPEPAPTAARANGTIAWPVRVGLIGPGGFAGRVLIPALKAAGANLVVVGGGAGPSASAVVRAGTFQRTAPDASAVITDPQVDAVVVTTRHRSHHELVSQSLLAGKHVFCEKPLALTDDERQAVMEAAQSSPGTLLVGFNRRFSPLLQKMRSFLAVPRAPMTLAYRVSAGGLPPGHWVHDLSEGGGRALGEVCHFVDSVSYLAASPIVEVYVSGYGPDSRAVQGYDNLLVTLRCANSSVACVLYVADGSPRVPKERIEGFSGTRTAILGDYVALDMFDGAEHEKVRLRTQDKGHRHEMAAFLNAVRTGQPAVGLHEINNVTLATLATVESLRIGLPVRLTP